MQIQPFIDLCNDLNLTTDEIKAVSQLLLVEACERDQDARERKAELTQAVNDLHPLFQAICAPYFPKS